MQERDAGAPRPPARCLVNELNVLCLQLLEGNQEINQPGGGPPRSTRDQPDVVVRAVGAQNTDPADPEYYEAKKPVLIVATSTAKDAGDMLKTTHAQIEAVLPPRA